MWQQTKTGFNFLILPWRLPHHHLLSVDVINTPPTHLTHSRTHYYRWQTYLHKHFGMDFVHLKLIIPIPRCPAVHQTLRQKFHSTTFSTKTNKNVTLNTLFKLGKKGGGYLVTIVCKNIFPTCTTYRHRQSRPLWWLLARDLVDFLTIHCNHVNMCTCYFMIMWHYLKGMFTDLRKQKC